MKYNGPNIFKIDHNYGIYYMFYLLESICSISTSLIFSSKNRRKLVFDIFMSRFKFIEKANASGEESLQVETFFYTKLMKKYVIVLQKAHLYGI